MMPARGRRAPAPPRRDVLRATPSSDSRMKLVPVSNGEIADKISILRIKLDEIADPAKRANVEKEFRLLLPLLAEIGLAEDHPLYLDLLGVNRELWVIEDDIRDKERRKEFDERFVELARSVYFRNDRRAEIKRAINEATGSGLVEEKSYRPYA